MINMLEDNWAVVNESPVEYGERSPVNQITYQIIGACLEVHDTLGKGFSEIVYKDALQLELKARNINFEREKKFEINYKGIVLPHYYYSDFIIESKVILEVKAQNDVIENHTKQTINYLAVSNCEIGLLVNFGEESLKYKRIILTK